MTADTKYEVAFVGGGQMAQALVGGAIRGGVLKAGQLVFVQPERSQDKLRKTFPESRIVSSAAEGLSQVQRVVLAVKPHVLLGISEELRSLLRPEQLVISLAAGISLTKLQQSLSHTRVVRVMPNTPALVGAGASAFSADENATDADLAWVERLLNSVGISVRLNDDLIHAFTGVAGSSPAYSYLMIEALSDGGVAQGLPRATSTRMAAQALMGAAKMVLETGLHPGQLKDQVTSPGGTTIAALAAMESAGVRSGLIQAVAACAERSREMGQ